MRILVVNQYFPPARAGLQLPDICDVSRDRDGDVAAARCDGDHDRSTDCRAAGSIGIQNATGSRSCCSPTTSTRTSPSLWGPSPWSSRECLACPQPTDPPRGCRHHRRRARHRREVGIGRCRERPPSVHPTGSPDFGIDEEDRRRARSENGWGGRFVVMHAGNQGLAQNVSILADLAELLRPHADIDVVVLGEGAGLPGLKRTIPERGLDNVTLLSRRPKPDAQRLMRAADVHVVSLVPDLWGCAAPIKTYGIMGAGRPFVAAVDRGSEPDRIVGEHDCGIRVPAGDAAALAQAVITLSSCDLAPLAKRSREAFERGYTRTVATGHIERLLSQLAGG